ncbi:MAG: BREX-1 system adenine-specific DNA-methyltransferase PglX, partial [Candidatus Caldarchaeum sp.]|nr:BREX-1 system adenine-specific DNA-methyltransferase PglX [Candidatus Caldarchaeum sp.]MDW8435966.1 Eco57I restriction-modification methylase domain-containing protein [Candidatus Caldarchaeum sp.]
MVEVREDAGLSRGVCSRVARAWRRNRLIRPLLVFTDGVDSYVVVVPGPRSDADVVRVLWLHDRLYRTDLEVIESLRFRENPEELSRAYDEEFLPYERVRQEFFDGYAKFYREIMGRVNRVLKNEKEASAYAQRFLGRLMFLYFLQRKGWLNRDRRFIDKIHDYLELNKVFYEALNGRGPWKDMPLLNGSLFEREKYLTKSVEKELNEHLNDVFLRARKFFNGYNFTVDETSPLEVEVSVDPLLLGTVFENLLEERERGKKGTFYTPVNEIGFMCRRALAAWLGLEDSVETLSNGEMRFRDGLDEFVAGLKQRKNEREIREFRERLLSLKVCDPAVGSGGFLVVMMQTILRLIQEVEEAVGWRSDLEQYKRRIIPNLYGFDIEGEAVEIARLRVWLSLIVDQREPLPLPNLDMNIVTVADSLEMPKAVQTVLEEFLGDPWFKAFVGEIESVKASYLNEHDPERKNGLRKRIEELQREFVRRTGLALGSAPPLEFFMPSLADVVVMNPPYVRQEKIPKAKKEGYAAMYKLDRTSDLYAFFMVRALRLLRRGGVAAMITSDKWLEVGYGLTLQRVLKPHIVAVFGQRMRSFGADINTVISVLKKEELPPSHSIQFVYLESYGDVRVRNFKSVERGKLAPGKWYYLRAPRIFEEVLLPKLTHKLKDFAEIRFGIKTGANEFFYMKDVTHLYEADYLSNPEKFHEWGVKAKTAEQLKQQGLVYIENEGKQRFVIDRKDLVPIYRPTRKNESWIVKHVGSLVLYTDNPGKYTLQYIKWGENTTVQIKKGKDKGKIVKGYNSLESVRKNKPWYSLKKKLKPTHMILNRFPSNR